MTIRNDDVTPRRQDDGQGEISLSNPKCQNQSLNRNGSGELNPPLPRPKRRPRRAKADRGLPPADELPKLARAYLERQRELWPSLVQANLLPEPTEATIAGMVACFQQRHRTGNVDVEPIRTFMKVVKKFGGGYHRYSCDGSDPTSIIDQLTNVLNRAAAEGRFIPWQYVFCDYSVSGLDASRQGYTSYKSVLESDKHAIETTYVDDFSRASRDEMEWWKLAAKSKRLDKRMIGASDGFDLSSPNWDVELTLFGLFSRLFIKQLREKVLRGMRGAADRGTCLGKLGLGFVRRALVDERGEMVRRSNGKPRTERCIDSVTSEQRQLAFELYVNHRWSLGRIARRFNELEVDGSTGWTPRAIRQLLWSPDAIGVIIFNKTRREFDWEEEKYVKVSNPHSEWKVRHKPELALVPIDLWKAARKRLAADRAENKNTGKRRSRNQKSATTLFSGTLFCQCCFENSHLNAELKLFRSAGKYRQMGCHNGANGKHGCRLTSSKSTQIIENCILGFLRDHVLTESMVEELLRRANEQLLEEVQKPVVDTTRLKASANKLKAGIERLVKRVEREEDDAICDSYDKRIKELHQQLKPLQAEIREAERLNRKKEIAPLDLDSAKQYLSDLRGLLNQDIPVAAEAIRALTGPITIRQEEIPGRKRGARWIATFTPDLMRLLRMVARDNGLPDSLVLENVELPDRESLEVSVEKIPKYEKLVPEFERLQDNGANVQTIANAYGVTWQFAKQVLDFGKTGKRPQWKAGKPTGTGSKPAKYREIDEQVAILRDNEKWSFPRIARELGVGESTVRRAYDYAHQSTVREAAERGETPDRGRCSHLGESAYDEIRRRLRQGEKAKAIAAKVRCGIRTVYRERRKMQDSKKGTSA